MKPGRFTGLGIPALVAFLCMIAPRIAMAIDPANIQAGPFYIEPTLKVETRYVDNLFRSENDEQSTWVLDTLPKVQAWLQNGNNTYSLALQLEDFRYGSSHDDDFTDYQGNLDIHHEFNAKNTLDAFVKYYDGHEERGTGLSEGSVVERIDEPVELETLDYGAKYTLGNKNTLARLEAGYRFYDREYQNFTRSTQYRNYEQDVFNVAVYYALGPKTDILAEVRYFDTVYDTANRADPGGSFDNEEYNYFVGVAWEATAKTSGSIKVGEYDRQYDSAAREDDDGFSWEVDVFYKPRTYSIWNFETRRFSQETNGRGDVIDTREYSVRWDHDWSSRSSTHFEVVNSEEDYTGSFRADDLWYVEAKYKYAFRRWLDLSGGYRFEDRDSGEENFDYDLNTFFIEAELSL